MEKVAVNEPEKKQPRDQERDQRSEDNKKSFSVSNQKGIKKDIILLSALFLVPIMLAGLLFLFMNMQKPAKGFLYSDCKDVDDECLSQQYKIENEKLVKPEPQYKLSQSGSLNIGSAGNLNDLNILLEKNKQSGLTIVKLSEKNLPDLYYYDFNKKDSKKVSFEEVANKKFVDSKTSSDGFTLVEKCIKNESPNEYYIILSADTSSSCIKKGMITTGIQNLPFEFGSDSYRRYHFIGWEK